MTLRLLLALLVSLSLLGCPSETTPTPSPTPSQETASELHKANGIPFSLQQDTKNLIVVFPKDRFANASFIEVSYDNQYQGFFSPDTKVYIPKPPEGVKRKLIFTPVDNLGQNVGPSQTFNIP